jgi:hypothetical protein
MFNFLYDMDNYDDRKVDRYNSDDFQISTASVSDGRQPYETAIMHIEYNDDKWIIVESYSSMDEAQIGHNKWVKIMTTEPLPEKLVDCQNAYIASLLDEKNCTFFRKV